MGLLGLGLARTFARVVDDRRGRADLCGVGDPLCGIGGGERSRLRRKPRFGLFLSSRKLIENVVAGELADDLMINFYRYRL